MSAYVVLSIPTFNRGAEIPVWVAILVIARDVLIVVVVLALYLAAGVREFPPSPLSKVNTALQVSAVVLVLVSGALPDVRFVELAADTAIYLVAGLTVATGLDYSYRVGRMEKGKG
jgi:phosphatidylglycerophosphate synthase